MAAVVETPWLYRTGKRILQVTMRLPYRPGIEGAQNIPATGPVILASNHLSGADIVFLATRIDRTVHFLGKSDLFSGRSLGGRITRWFMTAVGVMPIERTGGTASNAALEAGAEVLRQGMVLGIYPEGTRSPDGRLYRGRTGMARLALLTGAPIVPVGMVGTFEAMRGRRFLPRRAPRIRAVVGEPILASELVGPGAADRLDAAAVRRVTDTVMARIQDLSGQAYVRAYASEARKDLAEGRPAPESAPGGPLDEGGSPER